MAAPGPEKNVFFIRHGESHSNVHFYAGEVSEPSPLPLPTLPLFLYTLPLTPLPRNHHHVYCLRPPSPPLTASNALYGRDLYERSNT